jgi:hypothetical protein
MPACKQPWRTQSAAVVVARDTCYSHSRCTAPHRPWQHPPHAAEKVRLPGAHSSGEAGCVVTDVAEVAHQDTAGRGVWVCEGGRKWIASEVRGASSAASAGPHLSCFLGANSMTLYSLSTASLFSRSHTTAGRVSVGMMPTCSQQGGVHEWGWQQQFAPQGPAAVEAGLHAHCQQL